MAQYYQIQNLDDLKHIYADVQVVHVASDEVGVSNHNRTQPLLLPEEQILLSDGQQVVYQTTANNTPQYQQQGATHYIIGEDIGQQHQQQQTQHQHLMYHHNQPLEHHQQQPTTAPQQQHYQQNTQEQSQIQVMQQDHQLKQATRQAPAPQQAQAQQQVYYTTDHILQQNSIVQHSPQQQEMQQQQLHIQQYQQQQQIVNQQHALQNTQQHEQLQVDHQPQQQIVYRMQPQQQQQAQMLNNTHVIVQQSSGQQLLIQSPHHQEIIMRQPMQQSQQRIIYNTNRVVYSPQQQTQTQSILQQSPQHQQQQPHIQLQASTMHAPTARLVQTRVGTHPQQPQPQSSQHQQLQSSVVFHPIQAVAKQLQPQIRGAIRTKPAPRGGCVSGAPTQGTRIATALPAPRGAMRTTLLSQGTAPGQVIKASARPRSGATAGSAPRSRGAARGGRATAAAMTGGASPQITSSPVDCNIQILAEQQSQQSAVGQQASKNLIVGLNPQGQVKHMYRTAQVADTSTIPQQLVQSAQRTVNINTQRFRSPSIPVGMHNSQSNISASTSSGSSGNFELDLEDSIQAVVVKKDQQKAMSSNIPTASATAMGNTTLTTYYGAKDDDDNRIVRTQNGTCITLAEFKKRNSAVQNLQSITGGTQKNVTMRAGGPPNNPAPQNSLKSTLTTTPGQSCNLSLVQTSRLPQPQQQLQPESSSQLSASSSVHQTSHNNYEIQTQHVLQNRTGQQMAEKDRNSAKMLVILVSGEQRLITFTLPRESCTVQDLLEQVGVPFDNSTTIQCVENPGANVDFVVTVGFSVQESPSELISRAEQSLQMSRQQESMASATPTGSSNTSSGTITTTAAAVATAANYGSLANISFATSDEAIKDVSNSSSSSATNTVNKSLDEMPQKIIQGFFAICHLCGFSGYDHAKCERCKRVFLDPPKRVPCVKSCGTATANESLHPASRSSADISDKKRVGDMTMRSGKSGLSFNTNSARGRGNVAVRGRSGRSGRRAAEAEPVILTLSSDEEDGDDASIKGAYNISANNSSNTSATYKTFPFESTLPDKDENPIYADFERDDVTDLSNWPEKLSTTLECKMVRIGFYHFEPREPIIITSKGIRIIAPLMNNQNETCALHIHKQEVIKIIAHFSKISESMMCLCTLRTCAIYVKNRVNMNPSVIPANGGSKFSNVGVHEMRRIILQFDSISDQARNIIKSMWNSFDEISFADTQNLLQKAAEYDRQGNTNEQSGTVTTTTQLNANESRQLLIYPPGKGGISINTDDYLCLGTDQYLNDIIIDFYLKWVHDNVIPVGLREKTFIFSTFFYKRLTTLTRHHQTTEVRLTAAQKRHFRVQNWTKNVNLFEKDFIIIPINEQSHWFLAIICFPALKGPVTFDTNLPVEPQQLKKQKGKKIPIQIGNTTITPLSKRDNSVNVAPEVCGIGDEDSERDEAEGEESDLGSDDSDFDGNPSTAASTSTTAVPVAATVADSSDGQVTTIKQPLILIFDSLAGASRSRVVATLRDYLTCEYKAKMGDASSRIFNKDNMHGHCVKVPQQNNFTDCGLYLLQYVEEFFKDPIKNYRLPIKQLTNWFDTITVTRKREDISMLLQRLMNEKNGPHQKVILPEIPFPTLNGQLIEPPEGSNAAHKDEEIEEEAIEEEDNGGDGSSEMEVDVAVDETSSKAVTAASSHTSALVPTQGRKIVVKRRFPTSSGKSESPSLQSGARSVLKARKVEQ